MPNDEPRPQLATMAGIRKASYWCNRLERDVSALKVFEEDHDLLKVSVYTGDSDDEVPQYFDLVWVGDEEPAEEPVLLALVRRILKDRIEGSKEALRSLGVDTSA